MDATKGDIYKILDGNKQFIVPVYQRFYSWDKSQCERLWKDIVDMQKQNKVGHFVGPIVNIAEQTMPTGIQKFMIIDGQQRMTTLTLLLIALRNYCINNTDDKSINTQRIEMLLKNICEDGDERYKLLLTETDKKNLIDLIENRNLENSEQSKININYNYFYNQIENKKLNPPEIYEAIGKLQIVNITLERDLDDPQAIFESLNSTGKELSETDLIRNYILMGLEKNEQTFVYENIWRPLELLFNYNGQDLIMDNFFRSYLTMKLGRIPNRNHVYDEFKTYNLNNEFASIRELCQDVLKFAKYYTDIVFCKSKEKDLIKLYKDIDNMKMEVAYPFLLKVHDDCEKELITFDELKYIISLCINYVLRRNICQIPTNSLNKTFATLKNEIKHDDYVNSIKAYFVLIDGYKVFPTNEQFKKAFMERDIYNMRIRNFVLSSLENYDNKSKINADNYTVEHIMPQNKNLKLEWQQSLGETWKDVQKKYLHTIGNLTLTTYNPEMSDKSFIEKLEMEGGFKESALRLNSYIIKQNDWNEFKINERAEILANKAMEIWMFPDINDQELERYIDQSTGKESYDLSTYEFNEITRTLFDLLDKRIYNLSSNVKREFKKLYIAYKLDTNFVDVVVQKQALRLSINMKFGEVKDQFGICKDVTNLGRWGNGDVEISYTEGMDIDRVMDIIKQSFDLQME